MTGTAATSAERAPEPTFACGVGLRMPHLAEVAAGVATRTWFEVHPENVLANAHARELLLEVRERHEISLHTVGLSVGTASGLDREHLARLRALVAAVDPMLVSGHLAWSAHRETYLNDLLPLRYDDETLRVVATHVREIQDTLALAYVVENPACYVGFADSTLAETDFLAELVARTGCRLLCDVSNVFLSAANMGYDARAYVDSLPADAIAELHLGGFTRETDASGADVLIDTHASPIAEPVWGLYAHALERFGPRPTLIEWDNALPPFARLLAESRRADTVAAGVYSRDHSRVAAR